MNLSSGVDLVEVSRIERLMEKRGGEFLKRIFTQAEIKYIKGKNLSPQTISGIFAAKEAVSKTLASGIGRVNWKDIELYHDERGKPHVRLYGEGLRLCQEEGIDNIDISISHEKDYAIAFSIAKKSAIIYGRDIGEDIKSLLPKRPKDSHKGSFGRVGIIAGSTGMTGAAYLSAMASLRTGSGLVYNIIPATIKDILSIKLVEAIIKPVEDDGKGHFTKNSYRQIENIMEDMDVLALGPGIGVDKDRVELIGHILSNFKGPLVLDADGLNCLALGDMDSILAKRKGETVITPHLGELARLLKREIDDIKGDLISACKNICEKYNIITVVKGANSLVGDGDGRLYINTSGNPGMATAGSGDLLTGIIASFIGQGLDPYDAARLGVYCHGLAGDLAREDKGEYGMISRDILDNIPYSIKEIEK